MSDTAGFARRRAASAARGKLRGLGVINAIEVAGGPATTLAPDSASLRLEPDGTLTLISGSMSTGQGHVTAFAAIVAARLGLRPDQIRVQQGDTAQIASGKGNGGSGAMCVGGAAVVVVTDKLMERARASAADLLEAAEADLEYADGSFTIAGTDRSIGLGEIAGRTGGLAESASFKPPAATFPNGCHICEVEIDRDTGQVEVVSYAVADDVGRVLNPLTLEGQIHGGVAQGLGQALAEAIAYDGGSGQLLTGSFMDYAMPHARDLPMIGVATNEVLTAVNPLGFKGAGEAGTIGAMAAVMSAVNDALGAAGARFLDMPASPERVWRALQEAAR